MMRFSLIVCTRGRCDEIGDLFHSLIRQGRNDFEVILVDQNGDERLAQVVAFFEGQFPLRHVRIAGSGASRARNIGLDYASGELIGFPDDDCRYLEDYLEKVDSIFSEEVSVDCICGSPISVGDKRHGSEWQAGRIDLDSVAVLDRCQEFTIFIRRERLRNLRFNELLGVGAQTLWGAEEGPDLLIRLVQGGRRLVFFPQLLVYHPNKLAEVTSATLQRAAGYSRGRGCLFRLHRFPRTVVFRGLIRSAIGSALYLLACQPKRSAYYLAVVRGLLRGLLMSKAELAAVKEGSAVRMSPIQPIPLRPLPPEPKVSILIGNYNYARYLPAALDSLLAQTYTNWHAVVCDDGSSDDSMQVIERYARRNARIQVVKKSNGGQVSAMNAGYPDVLGDIVCFLDSDDIFDCRKVERVIECFRVNPEAGICNHFSEVIDADGNPQPVTMHRFLDSGWLANLATQRGGCVYVPTTSCMSLRREVADEIFPIRCHQVNDVDGYLGMVAQFLSPICVIDEQLSGYRVHANNLGGLTEPTPRRLQYEMQLIERRTANVKEFARQLGGDVAEQIALSDNPQYIQAALKLLAIERVEGRYRRALALIRRHPNAKWRAIWRAIFAAPPPLSRLAVPWMHRSYKMKALFHRFMGQRKATAI
jgi:glycosyltransferase involved in cell wall biosynthesis